MRCLVRDPSRAGELERIGCEVVRGDVLEPATLRAGARGDRRRATTSCTRWAAAPTATSPPATPRGRQLRRRGGRRGDERLVYLGGLGEPGSEHLRSRHQTAEVLEGSGVPLTYFRAAAVIGAGSESFRVVYYLVKRLPAMVTPRWVTTRTQPIAIADVVALPARGARGRGAPPAARSRSAARRSPPTGGMMEEMARALDRRPPLQIPVPLLTPRLSSLWIGLVTPVDVGVARPLIEGLATETVVSDRVGDGAVRGRARRRSARRCAPRSTRPSRG